MDNVAAGSGGPLPPSNLFKQAVGRYLFSSGVTAFTATVIAATVSYMLIPAGVVALVATAIFCKGAHTAIKLRASDGQDLQFERTYKNMCEIHGKVLAQARSEWCKKYKPEMHKRTPDTVRRDEFLDEMKASYGMLLVKNIQNLFSNLHND